MNPIDIIREAQENASEWLEMSNDPALLVAGILANKIIKLMDHIQYLERRIQYDNSKRSNISRINSGNS